MHKNLPDKFKCQYCKILVSNNLFKVNQDTLKLNKRLADKYHEAVVKSLWIRQCRRPDMQLGVKFNFTRVNLPDEDNLEKLKWLIGYLCYTRYLLLIAGIDDKGDVSIYIDRSHTIHVDRKGHSRLFVTIGRGAMINFSKKLGLVTISSTETEVVSNSERFLKCIWFCCFCLA